jgi:hypothetical protein
VYDPAHTVITDDAVPSEIELAKLRRHTRGVKHRTERRNTFVAQAVACKTDPTEARSCIGGAGTITAFSVTATVAFTATSEEEVSEGLHMPIGETRVNQFKLFDPQTIAS